ncbi:pentapeptide repeat-containing protein [Nostoc sp. GT001]|uniref:pentapeptide repeat-containing protein n=1 Tax=Nostoc sp. GT001 TaxID=3056647 RepID=UPI0025AAD9F4|nr:pentapeptide repeat-containing protein [Nostoc sp. GT001]MDM9580215.1 pentapeptide repeat-containing protein [Nostoc sp. GT001]
MEELDLREADLRKADLSGIDLTGANLSNFGFDDGVKLRGADLRGANLEKANLSKLDLSEFDLSGANLRGTKLKGTRFKGANPTGTKLKGTNLSELDLSRFDLSELDFSRANFKESNLSRVQALGTNFTRATFTGACIEDWHINSATNLEGVICAYIYLKEGQQERRPSSGNFAPGEFTKLFQKSLETVDLIFRNGIDWDAFAYSFKKLEVENQGAQLDVQSIEKKGDGILVVRVAVSPDADKAKIHNQFIQGYEFAAKTLEAQYRARLEDKDTLISKQEAQINRLFYIVEQQGSVQKALAENPRKVSNYNMQNPQFASGIVDANTVNSERIGGNIHNNA